MIRAYLSHYMPLSQRANYDSMFQIKQFDNPEVQRKAELGAVLGINNLQVVRATKSPGKLPNVWRR